jgi:hypothetical protein
VRAQTIQRIQSKALLPKHAPRPIQITAGAGFEDDLNGHCFRIYLDETAKQINGPFPNPLWSKLIPQISEQEPFVRSAIIAIGALGRHSRAKSLLQSKPFSLGFQGKDYQHALKLYEKSLRGMRDAIATGKHNLRNALIACLLVFIFEGMLGNQAAAAAHAESGLNLLFQSAINDIPGRSWEVRKAATHKYFEEDLLMAFNALDLQVLLFIDRRSKTVHEQMKSFQTRVIGTLPVEFRSLNEARFFWQLIVNRNYHFLKSLQSLDMEILQEDILGAEGGSANMDAKELLLSDPKEGPLTQKEEHLRYRIDIGRWNCMLTLHSVHFFQTSTSCGFESLFQLWQLKSLAVHKYLYFHHKVMLTAIMFSGSTISLRGNRQWRGRTRKSWCSSSHGPDESIAHHALRNLLIHRKQLRYFSTGVHGHNQPRRNYIAIPRLFPSRWRSTLLRRHRNCSWHISSGIALSI